MPKMPIDTFYIFQVLRSTKHSFPCAHFLKRSKRHAIDYCSRGQDLGNRWIIRTELPCIVHVKYTMSQTAIARTFVSALPAAGLKRIH